MLCSITNANVWGFVVCPKQRGRYFVPGRRIGTVFEAVPLGRRAGAAVFVAVGRGEPEGEAEVEEMEVRLGASTVASLGVAGLGDPGVDVSDDTD